MRIQGWETLLADFIESVRNEPFKRGRHDCAVFAGRCVDLITGKNLTGEFIGTYQSRKKAYDLLKRMGLVDLESLATDRLGEPMPSTAYAGRGDVILVEYEGEDALAIVDLSGRFALTVGKDGLARYPRKYWSKAWKV